MGARNAQAISKVCIAGLARIENGAIEDARIAFGSVAPVPIRLLETERILNGQRFNPALVENARKIAAAEIRPIGDIRSTAKYRAAVVSNLVGEFLETLAAAAIGDE